MKIQKKQLQAAIAVALTLTIAATLLTAVPITLGQATTAAVIRAEAYCWEGPRLSGINQNVLIQGTIAPRPIGYNQIQSLSAKNVYYNLTFTITKPDGKKDNIKMNTNDRAEAWFWYNCTQLGTYNVNLAWPGDDMHTSAATRATGTGSSGPAIWDVQAAPVPPIQNLTTNAELATTPQKIGTGENIYLVGWITPVREQYSGIYYDLTFTITKPDGTTDKITKDSETPATVSINYLCDQAGTWKATLSYPGDKLHNGDVSPVVNWTVEDGYVAPTIPQQPLPTGQWWWPVSAEYQQWYQITGAWLQYGYNTSRSSFNPYSTGPNTPHVLYKLPFDHAGLLGGENGGFSWNGWVGSGTGEPAGPAFPSLIAAQGRVYYVRGEATITGGGTSIGTHPVLYCFDQLTGERIYRRDLPGSGSGGTPALAIKEGYKLDPNLGFRPETMFAIWLTSGGVWEIDPWTGETMYYNSSISGTYHDDGYIYMEDYPLPGNWTKWDTRDKVQVWTKMLEPIYPATGEGGYAGPDMFWNDIGASRISTRGGWPVGCVFWTWNLTTGDLLAKSEIVPYTTQGTYQLEDGKVITQCADRRTRAIDAVTGKVVWTSDPMEYPWGTFSAYTGSYSWGPTGGNGQCYFGTYDGHLYAYSLATGKTNWAFATGSSYGETAPGVYGTWGQVVTADSKCYFEVGEHTPPNPLPRGGSLYCVDANTGNLIWSLEGMGYNNRGMRYSGISSGILWMPNSYDGCTYFFGKGPTAVTVSAPTTAVPLGTAVLIQGTVTDQSSGAMGTPAISDADQAQWMQYLYMNKPMPTNATGVTVHLMAELSNGTVIDITHVTSDLMGHYETSWMPPGIECTYKILAAFEGSDSYYSSSAQTGLLVTEPAATPAAPAAAPDNTPIFATIIAAVIIVAILVLYNIITVRKLRK